MRVMLRRDLFLGGVRYRQNNRGTEVPDTIVQDGVVKKIVFWKKGVEQDPKLIPLPADAMPYDPGMEVPVGGRNRLWNAGTTRPVALSELHKVIDVQAEAFTRATVGEDANNAKARIAEQAQARPAAKPGSLGHPALAPSPDQPSVADQTGEKPPTALAPAIKPGADSMMADAKAGEGQPDPRTPAAEKAGKGIKPGDEPQVGTSEPARPIPPRSR